MSTEDMTKDTYEVNSSTMAVLPLGEGRNPPQKYSRPTGLSSSIWSRFRSSKEAAAISGRAMRGEKRAHMRSLKFPINRRSWWITQTIFFFFPHFPQLVLSAGGFPMRMFTSFARQSMTTRLSRLSTGKRWSCPYPSHLLKTRFTERHGWEQNLSTGLKETPCRRNRNLCSIRRKTGISWYTNSSSGSWKSAIDRERLWINSAQEARIPDCGCGD